MSTCNQEENQPCQSRHAYACPRVTSNDSGGHPPPPPRHSPSLPTSLHPPAITIGRDVEVQDTQMIRCWTFTALAAQPQGLAGQQPNRSLFFFFFGIFIFIRRCFVLGWLFLRLGELRLLSELWWKAIIKLTVTQLLNQSQDDGWLLIFC